MKVIQRIQGLLTDENGMLPEPVDMTWCRDTDAIGAASAVTTILSNHDDNRFFRTLDIRIEI